MPTGKLANPITITCSICGSQFLKLSPSQYNCNKCQKIKRQNDKKEEGRSALKRLRDKGKWPEFLEHAKIIRRHNDEKMKQEIIDLLGDQCTLCGTSGKTIKKNGQVARLQAHEIHGKRHEEHRRYIIDNYKDFTILCRRCHKGTHFCMEQLGYTWEDIKNIIKLKES